MCFSTGQEGVEVLSAPRCQQVRRGDEEERLPIARAGVVQVDEQVEALGGVQLGWGAWATWVGAGIAAYGAIYFGFHDVIVHRRIAHRYVARSAYMKRIVQAHRIHHATTGKHGSVSFGFIWAPSAVKLKQQLARSERALLRAPRD